MSMDTRAIITGTTITEVKKFILTAFNGKEIPFGSGGPHDATIQMESLNRTMTVMEHTWGKEKGNPARDGDVYLKLGCYGTSFEIISFIACYFGGYVEKNDHEDDYVKMKKNKCDCIRYYFESWEKT